MKKIIKYSPNYYTEFCDTITDVFLYGHFQNHSILCVKSREEGKYLTGINLLAALQVFPLCLHCGASHKCDILIDG